MVTSGSPDSSVGNARYSSAMAVFAHPSTSPLLEAYVDHRSAVLGDERRLERRRACVDSQKRRAVVVGKRAAAHDLGVVALLELGVFRVVGEQRGQAHDLRAPACRQDLESRENGAERLGLRGLPQRPRWRSRSQRTGGRYRAR